MLCFFCSSTNHLSENCNIYITHELKKERTQSKKCCGNCLNSSHVLPSEEICRTYQKCYNCFLRSHPTVYCDYPSTKSNLFLPNTDSILLPRFYQMLDFNKQLKLALLSPLALKIFNIQPCRIYQEIRYETNKFHAGKGFLNIKKAVVSRLLYLRSISFLKMNKFFNQLSSHGKIITSTVLKLEHCKVSAKDFLLLLSQNTKLLYCTDVEFVGRIEFADILEKVSYIFQIKLYKTNILYDSNWFEKYLKHRNVNYLKQLKIDTDKFAFDGETDHGEFDFRIHHFK